MTGNGKDTNEERLKLQSRISELALVPPWIERLATRHTIPDSTQFAMNLCLEEALSNVIRHGYSSKPDHSIAVQFASPRENYFVFVVEDDAPPFNPVDSPELPAMGSLDEVRVGGQGIRLMRHFADALEYELTPTGNRLSIGFSAANSAIAKG
jgi:anti-sigma regulatory factor (Ser/Thr protein kinase)